MMKNTMKKIYAASLIGVSAILAAPLAVNAAAITTYESSAKFETPNDDWHEISDPDTLITLTNGKDTVKVLKFSKKDELPKPVTEFEKYEEIYQTFYSTANTIFMITGFAQTKEDIDDVRAVVESIELNEKQLEAAKKEAAQKAQKEKEKENKTNPVTPVKLARTGKSIQLFNRNSEKVYLYEYNDGTWRDDSGYGYWMVNGHEWTNVAGAFLCDYQQVSPVVATGNQTHLAAAGVNAFYINEYTDGSWVDNLGNLYWKKSNAEWVDGVGHVFYDYDMMAASMRTINEMKLRDKDGVAIYIRQQTDGSWRDCGGTLFWANVDHQWWNADGEFFTEWERETAAQENAEVVAENIDLAAPAEVCVESVEEVWNAGCDYADDNAGCEYADYVEAETADAGCVDMDSDAGFDCI